jgi:hypothetical protein
MIRRVSSTTRQRSLAILWIGLFALSVAFPVVASVMTESSRPALLGPSDLVVAAVTAVLGLYLLATAGNAVDLDAQAAGYRVVRLVSSAFLVLIAVFVVNPSAFDWAVLGVGLAWRAWLLIFTIPGIVVHLR